MLIDTLALTGFRNYVGLDFVPCEGLNILVGSNAQGKSAVLEAIYLLATSKSHRTSRDGDMIRIGDALARVNAQVKRTMRPDVEVEIVLSASEKKSVKINKVRHPKVGDLVGQLNAVIFSSSDVDMVKGEPSRRRRFLNLEIAQVSPHYVHALGRYKRVLDQRNNLLREVKHSGAGADSLQAWDSQLAEYGATVISRRARFLSFLAPAAARIYAMLTDGSEKLDIAYRPNMEASADMSEEDIRSAYLSVISRRRELDVLRGATTTGPHRDDLAISINDVPAREFASQGQQRSAAIALKLAEIDLMEESVGEAPVVLLDDVMGELDELRRSRVLGLTLDRCQTLVTTTHLTDIAPAALDKAKVFQVRAGEVTPQ